MQEEVQTKGNTNTQVNEIKNLRLNQLVNFKDHPFKVETYTELFELMQSIEKDGVLVPLLARTNPNGVGYELISGHGNDRNSRLLQKHLSGGRLDQ